MIVSKVLNVSDIDINAKWIEIGFDYMNLRELIQEINEKHGYQLNTIIFNECLTLCSLAEYLTRESKSIIYK